MIILKIKIISIKKIMFSSRTSIKRCLMGSKTMLRVSQRSFNTDLDQGRRLIHKENTLTPEL